MVCSKPKWCWSSSVRNFHFWYSMRMSHMHDSRCIATKVVCFIFFHSLNSKICKIEPIGPHWLTRPNHIDVGRNGYPRTNTMNEDHGVCVLCQMTYLIKYIQLTSIVSFGVKRNLNSSRDIQKSNVSVEFLQPILNSNSIIALFRN